MFVKQYTSRLKKIGNNEKIVIKNSIFSMAGSILGQLFSLFTSLAMGRILGVEGIGIYTFAITLSGLIFLFLNLGLGSIFHRNISRNKDSAKKNFSNVLALRLFFSLPMSFVFVAIFSLLLNRQKDLLVIATANLYCGLAGLFTLVDNGITAVERFNVTFIFDILQKALCFCVSFLVLFFTRNLVFMIIANDIIFIFLITAQLLYVNKKICEITLEIDFKFCINLLKESFPTIFGSAAEYLSLKSDILVLSIFIGENATGIYSVASNIYIAASFIPLAMAKAITPTFNRMNANGQKTGNLIFKTLSLMILSALCLILGIFLLGRFGIEFLWGQKFSAANIPLRILSISLLFMPINRLLEYLLIGLRRQVLAAKSSVVGAIFNVVSNIVLVPIIGINAVAITTVFTELIVMAIELCFFLQKDRELKYNA